MTWVQQGEDLRPSGAGVFVPLVIATVGTVIVILLFFVMPGFQAVEMLALLLAIAITAIGYNRRTVRGLISYCIVYFSSAVAASLYRSAAPSVAKALSSLANPFSEEPSQVVVVTRGEAAFTFALLAIVLIVVLELLARSAIPSTELPKLRLMDNIGGIVTYLAVALVASSLFFNTLGYGGLRSSHNRSQFRDAFNQILRIHYETQSVWFPEDPPPLYVYDLDL